MASLGWRLRLWGRRLLPHTATKRLAYGSAVLIALASAALQHPVWTLGLLAAVLAVRSLDIFLRRGRSNDLSTYQTYFFEGRDSERSRR